MLDINLIRQNPEKVKQGVLAKNIDPKLVDDFLVLDNQWREVLKKVEDLRSRLNKLSKERKIEEAKSVKEQLKVLEKDLPALESRRLSALKLLPNLPLSDVPVGKNETGNVVIKEIGPEGGQAPYGASKKSKFDFAPKDYLEFGHKLDLIDTERAAKVSGSRFGYLKNEAPLLEFALAQFAFDFLSDQKNIAKAIKENKLSVSDKAFIPVIPPVLIKPEAMQAMGYVERGGDEIYFIEKDKLYLVGTSEQSVGPMHMDEVFNKEDLPCRYIAFSTCFRREAGSYGKDTKGILRVHQFDKLEMFVISAPETSIEEHKLLLALEEKLMQALELPYRVLQICTGDLGDPAAAKYDIEVWLPGQNNGQGEYRETHSTSNTTDYQARRLNIRYRPTSHIQHPTSQFVHLLNGTAFAIGRILIAILENYQTKQGAVKVPKVLQKYCRLKEIRR